MYSVLYSQVDSTFIQYYYPNAQTHPYWYNFGDTEYTKTANVFETYDNKFVLQSVGTFHTPPPEVVFDQSPMIKYSRQGIFQGAVFGPVDGDGGLLNGHYERIIKDGLGGYLALNSSTIRIDRIDANLNFVEPVILHYSNGNNIYPKDILPDSTGFVLIGGTGSVICAKFDFNLNMIWHYLFPSNDYIHSFVNSTSDGGYLFSFYDLTSRVHFKVNSQGDSIWLASSPTYVTQIIEANNKYYGLKYSDYDIYSGRLYVYDFGTDFSNPSPTVPIRSIVTYRLLMNDDVFSCIRKENDDIILAVSTPNGEIFRYDSDFNLIWSADYLSNERIGVGRSPLIELGNGDFLYCARTSRQGGGTDKFILVRITSDGHVTPINDEFQEPIISLLSVYPNPFTHSLNFELNSDFKGDTKIAIYNIKGHLVEAFILKTKTTAWKPLNLASGIYIVKLLHNKQIVQNVKITYIR